MQSQMWKTVLCVVVFWNMTGENQLVRGIYCFHLCLECQSQSDFTSDGLPPINSFWRQAPWDSRQRILIFQLNTCGYSPYVTFSLTRGCVCRLQLLLGLASAVILRSESRGTQDHILLPQIRHPPQPSGPGPCIYISQEQGCPVITPGTGFPFRRLLRLAGPARGNADAACYSNMLVATY
jgi:hypothetical protein